MTKITKIVYIVLILLLVIVPFFITKPVLFVPESHAEALTILIILGVAYLAHLYDVRLKEKEKMSLEKRLQTSIEKMNESLKYVGLVNRRLPLLKSVTTELLSRSGEKGKTIFEELLAIATSTITKSDWAMFRFIKVSTQNTVKEFCHTSRHYILLKTKVGNKDLLETVNARQSFGRIDDLFVLNTSDTKAEVQCFLIFPKGQNEVDKEYSVLQAIVDQAQLFYEYLR
ncbi:MAG: hypothetical protein WCE90_12240 [Candidatus Zixiibacteriota bacterium]